MLPTNVSEIISHLYNDPSPIEKPLAEVQLQQLLQAFQQVLQNLDVKISHQIKREGLSIREKMTHLLAQLQTQQFTPFYDLFIQKEGRQGVVVTFIAMLELLKAHLIDIVQAQFNAPIYLRPATDSDVFEIDPSEDFLVTHLKTSDH